MESELPPEESVVEPTPTPYINPNARIIYRLPDNGVAIVIPSPDCGMTIEQIAAKDVPAGLPYKFVDASDIPSDRTFRNAWEYSAE